MGMSCVHPSMHHSSMSWYPPTHLPPVHWGLSRPGQNEVEVHDSLPGKQWVFDWALKLRQICFTLLQIGFIYVNINAYIYIYTHTCIRIEPNPFILGFLNWKAVVYNPACVLGRTTTLHHRNNTETHQVRWRYVWRCLRFQRSSGVFCCRHILYHRFQTSRNP